MYNPTNFWSNGTKGISVTVCDQTIFKNVVCQHHKAAAIIITEIKTLKSPNICNTGQDKALFTLKA